MSKLLHTKVEVKKFATYNDLTSRRYKKEDQDSFHHESEFRLVYTGLNINFIKAFMANSNIKANGRMCYNSNIRMYKDPILRGSKQNS